MRIRWAVCTMTLLCMAIMLSVTAYAVDKSVQVKMRTEQRMALVIGNSAYESRPLKNPVNDAKAIATALKKCGFQVIQKTDCSRSDIRKAVREFGDKIKAGGVGLFYYSGHGIQVKGENYLVPVGADVRAEDEVEDECIKMSAVLRKMESAGNRVNIVILDACRNNPFARSFGASSRGLARMAAPKGTFIAYATAPGSIASDGTGDNGVYTSALLKHIVEPGMAIENVFKTVRVDVIAKTSDSQVPWESSSLTGDFYFVLPDSSTGAADLPPTKISPIDGRFQMGSNDGRIEVRSVPNDAIVSVTGNGRVIRGKAPVKLDIYPGQYKVEFEHELYINQSKEVVISGGQTTSVSVQLNPNFGVLDVQVTPAKSQILVDGMDIGQTPTRMKFPPGTYKVEVHRDGFMPMLREEVALSREQTITMIGTLQAKTGMLTVTSEPLGADIKIDKSVYGVTPQILQLPIGSHVLKLSKLNYQAYETDIAITMDEVTEHFAKLSLAPYMGKDGALMVMIPEGEFQMGGNNVRPVETVYLDAFYMDRYAVSNAQYKKFIDAIGHRPSGFWNDPNYNAPNHPVVGVSWHSAVAYAEWAGKRLPTDAEWEKAARGGLSRKLYPWGNNPPNGTQCNFADRNTDYDFSSSNIDDGYKYTAPVNAYSDNGYGLFNMVGNVWEWCADWDDKDYHKRSPYKKATQHNPTGPTSGEGRVLRGGSWAWNITTMRITSRFAATPDTSTNLIGFRCVKDIPR